MLLCLVFICHVAPPGERCCAMSPSEKQRRSAGCKPVGWVPRNDHRLLSLASRFEALAAGFRAGKHSLFITVCWGSTVALAGSIRTVDQVRQSFQRHVWLARHLIRFYHARSEFSHSLQRAAPAIGCDGQLGEDGVRVTCGGRLLGWCNQPCDRAASPLPSRTTAPPRGTYPVCTCQCV